MRGHGLARTGGWDRRAAGAVGRSLMDGDSGAARARQSVAQTLGRNCGIFTVGGTASGPSPTSCDQSVGVTRWPSSNLPAGRAPLGRIQA